MDFKTYYFGLSVAARDAFAQQAGTTRGLLTQVAYGNKSVELGFADVICAVSRGSVTLDGLPLTHNAKRQRVIRESVMAGSRRRVNRRQGPAERRAEKERRAGDRRSSQEGGQ